MDRRPPIQLRGSAGFAPASRTPEVKVYYTVERQQSTRANEERSAFSAQPDLAHS